MANMLKENFPLPPFSISFFEYKQKFSLIFRFYKWIMNHRSFFPKTLQELVKEYF